jgi:hypothetical protein
VNLSIYIPIYSLFVIICCSFMVHSFHKAGDLDNMRMSGGSSKRSRNGLIMEPFSSSSSLSSQPPFLSSSSSSSSSSSISSSLSTPTSSSSSSPSLDRHIAVIKLYLNRQKVQTKAVASLYTALNRKDDFLMTVITNETRDGAVLNPANVLTMYELELESLHQ